MARPSKYPRELRERAVGDPHGPNADTGGTVVSPRAWLGIGAGLALVVALLAAAGLLRRRPS